ncbi:hypothetical protein PDESU_04570 [Pontiella desulfatans]|uniref:PIN domain-containing protein n=1 Tax=Pontiella desulfatans TaxID=2750659 RepID=A0A6C2U901_PONDE|nr:hypothetical protein [Pontiella desulfatans]VGO15981.1 hypothetical protein PDESU_04570 [Pontiella desulfatans]
MKIIVDTSVWSQALQNKMTIYTTDGDFKKFAEHLPIALHVPE